MLLVLCMHFVAWIANGLSLLAIANDSQNHMPCQRRSRTTFIRCSFVHAIVKLSCADKSPTNGVDVNVNVDCLGSVTFLHHVINVINLAVAAEIHI